MLSGTGDVIMISLIITKNKTQFVNFYISINALELLYYKLFQIAIYYFKKPFL